MAMHIRIRICDKCAWYFYRAMVDTNWCAVHLLFSLMSKIVNNASKVIIVNVVAQT